MLVLVSVSLTLQVVVIGALIWLVRRSSTNTPIIENAVREELRQAREESTGAARQLREELSAAQESGGGLIVTAVGELGKAQKGGLDSVASEIKQLASTNEKRLDSMRQTIDDKLKQIQDGNEAKLEEMRKTVDEKLHDTLEKRLGESFKLVSQHLEEVQRGLGEMRSLATGVGDLKKVLSNVKTRGTLGEVQLGSILEDILTADQYDKNVQTKEGSRERVEYAVRLPGSDDTYGKCVWLPIDSKFPREDYERLVDATDAGDADGARAATASLVRSLKVSAGDARDKYVNPPATTDFVIMFLPTEGLYGEVLRRPGLVQELMRIHRVVVAGPTTLAAILSSLRMGFRILAIEKRSGEVWQVLGAVKNEFGKFGDVLDRLKHQLDSALKTVEQTGVRTRAMERKLRDVERLPDADSQHLLELGDAASDVDLIGDGSDAA